MSYANIDKRSNDTTTTRDEKRCVAHGCPLPGTWSDGSTGRYVCSFHGIAQPDHWQHVTHELRSHAWLLALLNTLWTPVPASNWRERAHTFWEGAEDPLPPRRNESRDAYRARMWDELHWRVGTRKRRPEHAHGEFRRVDTRDAVDATVTGGAMSIGQALLDGPLAEGAR
jgi:hypothetical protein